MLLVLLLLLLLLLYQLFPTFVQWRCHVLTCLMRPLMHWHAGSTGSRSASGAARVNRGQWPNTSTRTELECFMQIPMCWHTGSTGSASGTARVQIPTPHTCTPEQPGVLRGRPGSTGAAGLTLQFVRGGLLPAELPHAAALAQPGLFRGGIVR